MDPALAPLDFAKAGAILADMIASVLLPAPCRSIRRGPMTMISKITDRHLSRQACIYVRQSTLAQVRSNQESTDRQYNLLNKAQSLGWKTEQIRVLDRDLGQSGAAATKRTDFKALVGDVAMGQIGAIFALEASRLARSNQDWHRLLELCAITGTLVIDEDGCYDPAGAVCLCDCVLHSARQGRHRPVDQRHHAGDDRARARGPDQSGRARSRDWRAVADED